MPPVRSAELCWGQHHHVLRYLGVPPEARHEAHIATSYPVPAGCTAAHARAALAHLARRHEVLRTVYDLTATPWPRQLVLPPGPPPVVEVSVDDDPAAEVARLTRTPFALDREGPLRACLITSGGRLRRLHLVFNHLAFDDVALDLLAAELDALLAARVAGRPVDLPPVADQPVDLAAHEATLAPEAALAHWRARIAELPDDIHAPRRAAAADEAPAAGAAAAGGAAEVAAHSASFTVPALLADARAVAARHRVWPSAVHLAAHAVALAAHTGARRVAARLYTSQRAASGLPDVLTCMSHPLLCLVDLTDDPTLGELVRRSADRVRAAMTHAHVPFDLVDEAVAAESAARGRSVRVANELNFLDNAPRSCRTRRERWVWNAPPLDWARAGSDLYLRVYEWSDGVTLALQALGSVLDRDGVERMLRGHAALLAAHRDPATDLRVSEAVRLFGAPAPARDAPGRPTAARRPGPTPAPAPASAARQALTEAVAEVNGLPPVDPALPYVAAGGRLLRLPRLVAALADRGWAATHRGLAAARPLHEVAEALRPCPSPNSGRTR